MDQLLPDAFTNACTDEQRSDAESWWSALPEATQSDIYVLLDMRNDSRAYVFSPDDEGLHEWREMPFVDDELDSELRDDEDDDWITELLHYRLDHEDFVMASDMKVRTFHICSQHPAANEVLRRGVLTCDFRCPAREEDCPIQAFAKTIGTALLIAGNRTTHLTRWLCIEPADVQPIGRNWSPEAKGAEAPDDRIVD